MLGSSIIIKLQVISNSKLNRENKRFYYCDKDHMISVQTSRARKIVIKHIKASYITEAGKEEEKQQGNIHKNHQR